MRLEIDTDKKTLIVKSKVNLGELNTWVAHNLGDPDNWNVEFSAPESELDLSNILRQSDKGFTQVDRPLNPYPGWATQPTQPTLTYYGSDNITNSTTNADCSLSKLNTDVLTTLTNGTNNS